jgi:hypothetical protein
MTLHSREAVQMGDASQQVKPVGDVIVFLHDIFTSLAGQVWGAFSSYRMIGSNYAQKI